MQQCKYAPTENKYYNYSHWNPLKGLFKWFAGGHQDNWYEAISIIMNQMILQHCLKTTKYRAGTYSSASLTVCTYWISYITYGARVPVIVFLLNVTFKEFCPLKYILVIFKTNSNLTPPSHPQSNLLFTFHHITALIWPTSLTGH